MKSLSLSSPHAIVMVGIPGSGKSFFAEKFAETFHAPFVSEQYIQYLTRSSNQKNAALVADAQIAELAKTKQSIVVEIASDTLSERAAITKQLHKLGYSPLFVWVQLDEATAQFRSERLTDLELSRQLSQEDHEKLVRRFKAPDTKNDNVIVISGKHTYATQARVILKKLSAPRTNITAHTSPPMRSLSDVRRKK